MGGRPPLASGPPALVGYFASATLARTIPASRSAASRATGTVVMLMKP